MRGFRVNLAAVTCQFHPRGRFLPRRWKVPVFRVSP
jgi:hypothetical protein